MRRILLESLLRAPLRKPLPMPPTRNASRWPPRSMLPRGARLGRGLSIRQVDAGSCNGCELEMHALGNASYDLERFGLRFVASPRHADVLLVTGPVTKNMAEALLRTYQATPAPKWGGRRRNLRPGRRRLQGKLRLLRRRLGHHPGRLAHPGLPADPHGVAQGPAGADDAARSTPPRSTGAGIMGHRRSGDRLAFRLPGTPAEC